MLFPPMTYLQMAVDNLPPKEEAWALIETYYQRATYVYVHFCSPSANMTVYRSHIIPRDDFIQRVLTPCYSGDISLVSPYRLSSLCSTLAIGALHDLTRPIYCPASREWLEITQSLVFGTFGAFGTSIESIEVRLFSTRFQVLSYKRPSHLRARSFHPDQSSNSVRLTTSWPGV